jgi:hypothetical protein
LSLRAKLGRFTPATALTSLHAYPAALAVLVLFSPRSLPLGFILLHEGGAPVEPLTARAAAKGREPQKSHDAVPDAAGK